MKHLPVLLVALPLFSAALMPLIAALTPKFARLSALIVMVAVHIGAWLTLKQVLDVGAWNYAFGGWPAPFGIEYVVDALSGSLVVLISLLAILTTIYSQGLRQPNTTLRSGVFEALFLLLLAGLLGIVLTGDMFNLYVFIEISSLAAYPLLASGNSRGVVATFRYLLISTIAASFYLLGTGFLYSMTGTLNMADMATQLELNPGGPALAAAIAFIVVGLAIKLALFPVHGWLPDVYTYAPTPVIGFVAAVMTKVSAYALFRILYFVLNGHGITTKALETLGWIAGLGILAGSLMALVQKDIRRILAYSSISQLGYIVLGFAIGNTWALTGALLHVINHAVIKSCLFLTAGACQWKTGATRVAEYASLGRRLPITIGALTVSAIALVGLPPTAGFFSKWYLAVGILQAGNWPFLIILILSSLLSAVYFYRIVEQAYFGPADTAYLQNQTSGKLELPVAMLSPIVLLAVAAVLLGIFNQQIVASVITKALPILP